MISDKALVLIRESELNLVKKLVSTILKYEFYKNNSQFKKTKIIEELITQISNIEKKRLIFILRRHRLLSIFYTSFFLKKFIPNLKDNLRVNYILNLQQNLSQINLLKVIQITFNENNIDFLLFKGIATSIKNYQNPYSRGIGDIDIFIEKDNLEKAIKVLSKIGFKLHEDYHYPKKIDSIFGRLFLLMCHEITLIRKKNSAFQQIDLHWRLSPTRKNIPNFQEAWEERQQININNIEMNSLSLKHSFINSCAHAAKDQWMCIRNLIDIYQFAKKLDKNVLNKLKEIRFIRMSLFASYLITNDNTININSRNYNFLKFYVKKISEIKQSFGRRVFGKGKWSIKVRIFNSCHNIYFTNSFIDLIYILLLDLITPKYFINKETGEGNNLFIILKLRLSHIYKRLFKT